MLHHYMTRRGLPGGRKVDVWSCLALQRHHTSVGRVGFHAMGAQLADQHALNCRSWRRVGIALPPSTCQTSITCQILHRDLAGGQRAAATAAPPNASFTTTTNYATISPSRSVTSPIWPVASAFASRRAQRTTRACATGSWATSRSSTASRTADSTWSEARRACQAGGRGGRSGSVTQLAGRGSSVMMF